jgi:hypothetical protein
MSSKSLMDIATQNRSPPNYDEADWRRAPSDDGGAMNASGGSIQWSGVEGVGLEFSTLSGSNKYSS